MKNKIEPDVFWQKKGYCLECHKVHKKDSAMLRCKEDFMRKGKVWAQTWMTPEGGKGNKPI